MSIYTGRDAKCTFGATLIADLVDYSFSLESPILEEPVFGDEWARAAGQGIKSSSGSLSGLMNTGDTDGQVALENAVISGTLITDFRLYINPTEYWTSNIAADTDAGVYFNNLNVTASPNDITKISCDFRFTGEVYRTS